MAPNFGAKWSLDYVRAEPPDRLLDSVSRWIDRVRPTALLHPHGFYVILLSRTDSAEWRFHIWPKGKRSITGLPCMVHTHDKTVESKILLGQLVNVEYSVSNVLEDGLPIYEVAYKGDKYDQTTSNQLNKTGVRVEHHEVSRLQYHEGDSYCIQAHSFHEAIVPEDISAATIVCMHSRVSGAIRVLGVDGYPETVEFHRNERSAKEINDLLSVA